MPLISIDPDRCIKDGHCVAECSPKIIEMGDDLPFIRAENEERCIDCGHCVAVCPTEALTLKTLSPAECSPLDKSLNLSEEQATQFLRSRRSIRTYKNKSVDRETLQKLIDLARYAPTGSNKQPVQWIIIQDPADVQTVSGMVADWMRDIIAQAPEVAKEMKFDTLVAAWESGVDRICRNAPHLAFAFADQSFPNAQTDCAIALSYLELFLPTVGLGGCWGGYTTFAAKSWQPLKEFINLPENTECHGVMMMGYPRYQFHRMPTRREAPIIWR